MALRGDIVFFLTMISFLGSIGILISGFIHPDCFLHHDKSNSTSNENETSIYYLKENKLKMLIDIDIDNKYQNITLNRTIFFDEEQKNILEKSDITDFYKQIPKLRKLSTDSSLFNISIIINFVTMYFSIILIISFFIDENECLKCIEKDCYCDYYCKCCPCCGVGTCSCCVACSLACDRAGDSVCPFCDSIFCCCCVNDSPCNCNGCDSGGGGEGYAYAILFLLVLFIISGFFYLMYFFTKLCRKDISRYISLFIIFIINIAVFFNVLQVEKELATYITLSISGVILVSYILSIIIEIFIYFNCCCRHNTNLGTINPELIVSKKVEENNKNDFTPKDKDNEKEYNYSAIDDSSSDASNRKEISQKIN